MEPVQLVHRQNVDIMFHIVDTEEVAAHVKHSAPISEMGFIGNFNDRQFDDSGLFSLQHRSRQQLSQSLNAIKYSGRRSSGNLDLVR